MSYWHGKRAVIVGGSAGLGRVLAAVLAEHGARLAIVARRQLPLEATAQELKTRGANVLSVAADVTNADDINRLGATVQSAWGGIDLLCHCAGRSMRGTTLATTPGDFRELWETNFLSAVRCIQQFSDSLMQNRGHIVLVGSLASKVAAGYLGAYPASKFPLAALAQQMRLETSNADFIRCLFAPARLRGTIITRRALDMRFRARKCPRPHINRAAAQKVRAINPHWLAKKILRACEQRRAELVVPKRARLLFAVSQLSPRFGDWLLRRMTSG